MTTTTQILIDFEERANTGQGKARPSEERKLAKTRHHIMA